MAPSRHARHRGARVPGVDGTGARRRARPGRLARAHIRQAVASVASEEDTGMALTRDRSPVTPTSASSTWTPLRIRVFRAVWAATLLSNLGSCDRKSVE